MIKQQEWCWQYNDTSNDGNNDNGNDNSCGNNNANCRDNDDGNNVVMEVLLNNHAIVLLHSRIYHIYNCNSVPYCEHYHCWGCIIVLHSFVRRW